MAMKLIESTHTYVNGLKPKMKYISCTTLIGEYHQKFDTEFHSKRVAERRGVPQDVVKMEWERTNRLANEFGTAFHKTMEDYLLSGGIYVPKNDQERLMIESFKSLGICGPKSVIRPEHIMSYEYDEDSGLAGTADIIEEVNFWGDGGFDDKRFNVWDFKTNKEFKFETRYKSDWMYFPIDHLSYTHLNAYTLQMSIYALMYERESGRRCNRMALLYWDRVTEEFRMINVPYMKLEAQSLIDHFGAAHLKKYMAKLKAQGNNETVTEDEIIKNTHIDL